MKFIIPQKEGLTRETIKEEFLKKYYPELKVSKGWWNIYGRYVMLQKNPFICAKFWVKQKDWEGKTQIRVGEDQNMWAHLIGAPIFRRFIKGDFYDDLFRNFSGWLIKKYGLSKDEIVANIPWIRTKFIIESLLLAGIVVGLLLFLADITLGWQYYENPTLWQKFLMAIPNGRSFDDAPTVLLMFVAFGGLFLYFGKRRQKRAIEKFKLTTGLTLQSYRSKSNPKIRGIFVCVLLYLVLYFLVALVPNLIDNLRPRSFEFENQITKTYVTKEIAINNDNDIDEEYSYILKTTHSPSGKTFEDVEVLEEYNGYALCAFNRDQTFGLCNPEGEAIPFIQKEMWATDWQYAKKYYKLEFLTPEVIWDGYNSYFGLDAKPTNNLTVLAFKYKDAYVLFAVIAAVLLFIIVFLLSKMRKKNTSADDSPVETDETIV